MIPNKLFEMCQTISETGCWIWMGTVYTAGYGRIGRNLSAHRVSFESFKRKLKPGECVLHTCHVKPCINPNHLYAGNHSDNARDANRVGKGNVKLTEEQVKEIYQSPNTISCLAKKYGVSNSTISSIRYNINWRHITSKLRRKKE